MYGWRHEDNPGASFATLRDFPQKGASLIHPGGKSCTVEDCRREEKLLEFFLSRHDNEERLSCGGR